jgi:amidase
MRGNLTKYLKKLMARYGGNLNNFSKNEKDTILEMKVSEMQKLIKSKKITSEELTSIHIGQIEKYDSKINSVCTFTPEIALEISKNIDKNKDFDKPLSGIPILIKDLNSTKGIRTTKGSKIYSDFIPDSDDLVVQNIKKSGAIILGKSNTPEFGAGSHTFNDVFGTTYNPYNTSKTAGGSSGGAGAALASRMVPIAQGSDMGGSLRNPAAWNNVVGFRNSLGRVPNYPNDISYNNFSVNGPMARTVDDIGLLLSIMAGYDSRIPNSINEDPSKFVEINTPKTNNIKIAYTEDLGIYPVSRQIKEGFSDLGFNLENTTPDLPNVDNVFQVFRAYSFAHSHKDHIKNNRNIMKDSLIWNVEKGLNLTSLEIANAESQRLIIDTNISEFFDNYDFLILPSTSVLPFNADEEYVDNIDGQKLETYIDWMGLCYAITVTGCPSISIPAGFSSDGLPMGIQIVGRKLDDLRILELAKLFENETKFYKIKPNIIL